MKPLTVGFELEFEGMSVYSQVDYLRDLFRKFGDVKADGSLAQGFELASRVSRDNTFRSYRNLDDDWQRLFAEIGKLPVLSRDNTGMHVHVGRNCLSTDEIIRINEVVHLNKVLDILVGGRGPNRWCDFVPNTETDIMDGTGAKYRFLNVGRSETIEFRFFKVPTSVNRFLCNIQYVLAIVDFARSPKYVFDMMDVCGKQLRMHSGSVWLKRSIPIAVKNFRRAFLNHINKGDYLDLNIFLYEHKTKVTKSINSKAIFS